MSEHFIEASRKKLEMVTTRSLAELSIDVMMIDGTIFKGFNLVLPEAQQHAVRYKMRCAYEMTEAADAKQALWKLQEKLLASNPSAAASRANEWRRHSRCWNFASHQNYDGR